MQLHDRDKQVRRTWWARIALAAFVLVLAGAGLGRQTQQASAVGEGVYNLDKTEYSVPEGTALPVTVQRTDGGVLTVDVQVTLTVDGDADDIPPSENTKLITFAKGTNLASQTVLIQTLNKEQFEDRTIQVTILSVSGGGLIGPRSTAPITLLGTGTPRVFSVTPRSGDSFVADGTILEVRGENFIVSGATVTSEVVSVQFWGPFAPAAEASPGGTLPYPGTEVEVISATLLRVRVPTLLVDYTAPFPNSGAVYDVRVQVTTTPAQVPNADFLSAKTPADQFVFTTGPTVTSVSPANGPPTGGTVVLVRGRKFPAFTGTEAPCPLGFFVLVGGFNASDCDVAGSNLLRIRTPEHLPGQVDITVGSPPNSPTTSQSKFTYTGAPEITALSPNSGPDSGGTTVVIHGSNFLTQNSPPSAVLFGGNAAEFDVVTDNQIVAVSPPGSGVQQVTIVHPVGGVSPFRTQGNFTYSSGPLIQSLSVNHGPASGGTVVTIRGSGFLAGATVRFGEAVAFSTVSSSTSIVATAPAGTGTVNVSVTVSGNTSPPGPQAQFSYDGPTVTSVSPIAGPVTGGTTIVIKGTNFTTASVVHFGGVTVVPLFVDTQTLTAVTPALTGAHHVRVTTGSGQSPENPNDVFTFTTGPIVDGLNPNTGPTTGATIVVITGKNFLAPLSVSFGGIAATSFNLNSATQITVLSPPNGTAGPVDVRVTKGSDVSPVGPLTKFTYTPATPKITSLTPNSSSTFGGAEVTLTGLGFSGASCPGSVKFGAVAANTCTVINDTTMTTVAPPNVAGATVVTVNTLNGTSDIVPNFTYISPGGPGGGTAPPAPGAGGTATYTLSPRWTLLTWTGLNNANITDAIRGTGVPGGSDLSAVISAIYLYDSATATYKAYFTGAEGIPGAIDITQFVHGSVYWVAILGTSPVQWVVNVP